MFDAKYNEKDPGKYERLSLPGGHRSSRRRYEQEGYEQEDYDRREDGEREYEQDRGSRGMFSRFTEHITEEMGHLGISERHRSHRDERYDDERYDGERYDGERSYGRRSEREATRIQLTRRYVVAI